MEAPTFPSQRKRIRFSYDEPEPDEPRSREKKPRFPKGKKEFQKIERGLEFEGEISAIPSTDPRIAAKERAGRRTVTFSDVEEVSIPADVYDAEEEYQDSYEEEGEGVTIEPFNLKQEREEGYFDADGNYVEYRNDNNVKDAWLDTVQVDTTLAAKHMKQYAKEEVEQTLSSKDLAVIKRRIADVLLPGETVLKALRRLKSSSSETGKHSKAKMSLQTKETFDMLTEDAMNLLDHGEYNVYDEAKETFQREAEGYEILEKSKSRLHEGASSSFDMFGDEEISGEAEKNSKATDNKKSLINTTAPSEDMFSEDENLAPRRSEQAEDVGIPADPGYVYDEASGYYYNSTVGYYYDGNTGLFCNASSGKWFRFDEESNSYVEIVEEGLAMINENSEAADEEIRV